MSCENAQACGGPECTMSSYLKFLCTMVCYERPFVKDAVDGVSGLEYAAA